MEVDGVKCSWMYEKFEFEKKLHYCARYDTQKVILNAVLLLVDLESNPPKYPQSTASDVEDRLILPASYCVNFDISCSNKAISILHDT